MARRAIATLVLAAVVAACSQSAQVTAEKTHAFTDLGISFTYPGDWVENRSLSLVPQPARAFGVTPDRSSGNWMMILFLPNEAGMTEDVFVEAALPDLERRGFGVEGPEEVEVAGVSGLVVSLSNITGDLTGTAYRGEIAILFGEMGTYRLQAQYDEESEALVLAAWEGMLNSLVLPEG